MTTRLVPCSGCARHVHDSERVCPFCGGSVAATTVGGELSFGRLSRAALILAGATAVAACGKSSPPNGPDTTIAQPYGAPPMPRDAEPTPIAGDAGATTATGTPPPVADAGPTPTAIAAPYGAPPMTRDAGVTPLPPKKK